MNLLIYIWGNMMSEKKVVMLKIIQYNLLFFCFVGYFLFIVMTGDNIQAIEYYLHILKSSKNQVEYNKVYYILLAYNLIPFFTLALVMSFYMLIDKIEIDFDFSEDEQTKDQYRGFFYYKLVVLLLLSNTLVFVAPFIGSWYLNQLI